MHVQIVSPLNCGATILAFDAAKGSYQVKIPLDRRRGLPYRRA